MSAIDDALPISTADLKRMGLGIPDYQNTIVVRSKNDSFTVQYEDNKSLYSEYINVSDAGSNLIGWESVTTSASHFTRTITVLKPCLIVVSDGRNTIGFKGNGQSTFKRINLGYSEQSISIQLAVSTGDVIKVRAGDASNRTVDVCLFLVIPYK